MTTICPHLKENYCGYFYYMNKVEVTDLILTSNAGTGTHPLYLKEYHFLSEKINKLIKQIMEQFKKENFYVISGCNNTLPVFGGLYDICSNYFGGTFKRIGTPKNIKKNNHKK